MDSSHLAVNAALNHDWPLAIKTNLEILKTNPKDIEALNRLGRAYLETGQKSKASTSYQKVIQIDKYNTIALRGLTQVKSNHAGKSPLNSPATSAPIFLEEPGITKTVSLTRLGDPKVLSCLHPGDSVDLVARGHCVSVTASSNQYIGRLPDDLAARMRSFLKAGNTYHAWIRSLDFDNLGSSLKIFIKEINRVSKFRSVPSFPITEKLTYAAFTPPELVHEEKPDTGSTEEDSFDRPSGHLETAEPEEN